MKRILTLVLSLCLIVCSMTIPTAFAEDNDAGDPAPSVPRIVVTTENGNGTLLQKIDGYVNAEITITDTDGSVLSGSIEFKVRGNSTALMSVTKKAYTFKFGKKQNVLGMGKAKKWALLANAFDSTLMRNYIALDLAQKMGLPYTSQQHYVELWLDGSFRGCYVLTEPIQQGKERVDIDIESNGGMKDFLIEREATRVEADVTYFKTDGIRFAVNEPEAPNTEQLAYIQSTMDNIMSIIKSGDREAIEAAIDIPSFTRFYLLNELYETVDFDFSSVFFYYKDGKLYAGPAWDYDLAAGNENENYSATSRAAKDPSGLFTANYHLYKYLCSYDWFRDEITAVYREYYDEIENIYADGGLMDQLLAAYGDVFTRNYTDAGWSPSKVWVNVQMKPFATFDENLSYLRNWLRDRNLWLSEYYPVQEQQDGYLLGDADDDGAVTILDATRIQRLLVGLVDDPDGSCALRGDVSCDGLDILDATCIQRWLADFTTEYPIGTIIPYPAV